jgi:hypothetical protein
VAILVDVNLVDNHKVLLSDEGLGPNDVSTWRRAASSGYENTDGPSATQSLHGLLWRKQVRWACWQPRRYMGFRIRRLLRCAK